MKLERQVVSLELAQKLKKFGVKQESLFGWYGYSVLPTNDELEVASADNGIGISAFTVAELGEILPQRVSSYRYERWTCTMTNPSEMITYTADTEADARAKMLIYLIENNLLPEKTKEL